MIAESTPTDRLAQAFQTLVRDAGAAAAPARARARRRRGVAARQHRRLRGGLEPRRGKAADVVLATSRSSPTSTAASCRARARRRSKSSRSATTRRSGSARGSARSRRRALRALDLTLLLDLLRIEQDDERWGELMTPVVALLEDLLLVGDFDAADRADRACWSPKPAAGGVDGAPPARDHRDRHAGRRLDDAAHRRRTWPRSTTRSSSASRRCACRSARCWSARWPRRCRSRSAPRTRERLTAILIAFGAVGRRTIERLKNSQNPAVRRTAI